MLLLAMSGQTLFQLAFAGVLVYAVLVILRKMRRRPPTHSSHREHPSH